MSRFPARLAIRLSVFAMTVSLPFVGQHFAEARSTSNRVAPDSAQKPVIKERAKINTDTKRAYCVGDYELSKDKKWCVKRCPAGQRYEEKTMKCEEFCRDGMIGVDGHCYIGV